MDNNYKIIIYGKKVYREYELEHDSDDSIKVGTSKGCNIRFNKENFFGDFSFEFLKSNDTWIVNSLEGVYFTEDGVMKVYSKELKHGDDLIVSNLAPENERIYFGIDRIDTDTDTCENIARDIIVCPKCDSKLEYDFVRYNHIGRAHCTKCDFASPKIDYEVTNIDLENKTMIVKHEEQEECNT